MCVTYERCSIKNTIILIILQVFAKIFIFLKIKKRLIQIYKAVSRVLFENRVDFLFIIKVEGIADNSALSDSDKLNHP